MGFVNNLVLLVSLVAEDGESECNWAVVLNSSSTSRLEFKFVQGPCSMNDPNLMYPPSSTAVATLFGEIVADCGFYRTVVSGFMENIGSSLPCVIQESK